jgi:hypothetical protein
MSVVDEVRQVIQDFLAPELRALSAKLDAQDKVMEARFKEVDSRFKEMDSRFKEIDSRFKEMGARSDSKFSEVFVRIQALQDTVDRNDSAQKQLIAKLTQDFEFDKRLTEIERHIRLNSPTAA